MSIAERLSEVRRRIQSAAESAGRAPDTVQLVAVSKTQPASAVREAHAAGQRDFGENYLQELRAKADELKDLGGLRWHVIGHVQTNKAKLAVGSWLVHSVDSARLAQALGKRRLEAQNQAGVEHDPLSVLIEVNVAREPQKGGCLPESLAEVLEAVELEAGLCLRGLMTVPPLELEPEAARPYFAELRALRAAHGGRERLPELSMGMSHDLEVAVSEGASIVRVGSAVFGPRAPLLRSPG